MTFWGGMASGLLAALVLSSEIFRRATSTPVRTLTCLAALLRAISHRLACLQLVVELPDGQKVRLPFEQIAQAIEHAEVSLHRCDPKCAPPPEPR